MNQTHVHLLINHLPIFGSILGAIVLAQGIWTNSTETKIASYLLFIISSIGATIAYLTGEAAEESVENISGVLKSRIESHEEFSQVALVFLIVLGIAALIGLITRRMNAEITRKISIITLIISLVSFILVARTGYLGGQIRHTELNDLPATQPQAEEGKEDAD